MTLLTILMLPELAAVAVAVVLVVARRPEWHFSGNNQDLYAYMRGVDDAIRLQAFVKAKGEGERAA